jgi:hypothetical protein
MARSGDETRREGRDSRAANPGVQEEQRINRGAASAMTTLHDLARNADIRVLSGDVRHALAPRRLLAHSTRVPRPRPAARTPRLIHILVAEAPAE